MNNRQKAKHFKQLYEKLLAEPVPIIHEYTNLEHLRMYKLISLPKIIACEDAEAYQKVQMQRIKNEIASLMLEELESRVVLKPNENLDMTEAWLDIWLEREYNDKNL